MTTSTRLERLVCGLSAAAVVMLALPGSASAAQPGIKWDSSGTAEILAPPFTLELELTEGIMMDGTDTTITALTRLKELGVQLSIDDFGTGYSPLSYLSRFPLDELKIDRHFVARSRESETDANLVTGFIAMAKCMKLRLIATGVESPEQFDFLVSNGAYILQGYLFSEPVGAAQLASLLAPWHFMEQVVDLTNDFDKASVASNAKALPCN